MRGEDPAASSGVMPVPETPPHAWGRPVFAMPADARKGNTPTCVGKTAPVPDTSGPEGKHPHMRGEDLGLMLAVELPAETPPHAWGRRKFFDTCLGMWRNTPTCVGKTHHARQGRLQHGKHPHMRGEDSRSFPSSPAASETPPHAWGRHLLRSGGGCAEGNTPTCVGKTFF